MALRIRPLGWGAMALLAAGLISPAARAQTPLDLSDAGGVTWRVKDVAQDNTTLDPSKKDFTGDTDANGWSDAAVPADLNASGQVAENVYFWLRLDNIKIPADWPKDRYLILDGFNVDDDETTYFNGTKIGATAGAGTVRKYVITPDLIDYTGNNSIAILGHNATGGAGITTSAAALSPGSADTGIVKVVATNTAKNAPAPNVLVTYTNTDGTDVDVLTDNDGKILLTDLAPGAFPIQLVSYPWIGSLTPSGTQNLTVTGGKITELDLNVSPFVYTVAKAAKPITIDGNITDAEWNGAMQMSVDQKKQMAGSGSAAEWKDLNDLSGTAKWMYDDTYIYLGADVTDESRVNTIVATPDSWGSLWQGDGFETYIQLDPYDSKRTAYKIDRNYQWTMGVDPDGNVGWKIFRATSTPNDVLPPDIPDPAANSKVVKTAKGYILEARFAWASFPDVNKTLIPPKVGTGGAIGLAINDTDTPDSGTRETQGSWNTKGDMWNNPSSFTPSVWGDVPSTGGGVKGDLNGDGKVNIADATMALQFAVGNGTPTAAQIAAGDVVGGDGKIGIPDVTKILQAAIGAIQL